MFFILSIAQEYRSFYEMLYRDFKKPLWVYARSLTHRDDLADEAVQNAFVQLIKQSKRFDPSSTKGVKAYAIVTTRHEAYKIIKRESKGSSLIDDHIDVTELPFQTEHGHTFTNRVDTLEDIRAAVSGLNQVEKDIIYLRYRMDMKTADVAKQLELSATNVSTIQNRATKKLREHMQRVYGHAKR